MKFRYIGDDKQPPQKIIAFGVEFKLGKVSSLKDKVGIEKLKNNKCFEVVNEITDEVKQIEKEVRDMDDESLKEYVITHNLTPESRRKGHIIKAIIEHKLIGS